ncbi:LPS export ABC transporter periplasmic protein LptC [Qipengyuania sediminis]|uniref:LPS export ABC transporter periplasmic protein LptC n=1 Tax=Qipengyuania sediminis TaxID=1532023 RepID=UPI00105A90C3|nr:LPS export ABC transporter periplasmic protein LptC [Qipengyuania sediminis]
MAFRRKRIETREAVLLQSQRQRFAAPGGGHDRLVRFLSVALPMAVGVVAALMVITPLSPRGEVSFLLDRKKADVVTERLRAESALYRGVDDKGRPFSLTAGEAVQKSSAEGIVRMRDLAARLLLAEGPAQLVAPAGQFDTRSDVVTVPQTVRFTAADGYAMQLGGVSVDLPARTVTGAGGVSGSVPAGTFRADRIEADLEARTLSLVGNARLRMVPGALNSMRMPQ